MTDNNCIFGMTHSDVFKPQGISATNQITYDVCSRKQSFSLLHKNYYFTRSYLLISFIRTLILGKSMATTRATLELRDTSTVWLRKIFIDSVPKILQWWIMMGRPHGSCLVKVSQVGVLFLKRRLSRPPSPTLRSNLLIQPPRNDLVIRSLLNDPSKNHSLILRYSYKLHSACRLGRRCVLRSRKQQFTNHAGLTITVREYVP